MVIITADKLRLIKRATRMFHHFSGSKQNNYEELFMSKKLVKSLFIKENDDLSSLKALYDREQPCQFICKSCGKLANQHLRNINFLCKDCKTKQFCLEKYGVDNPSKLDSIKDIIRTTNKASCPETRHKYRETCKKKFGVDNSFKSPIVKEKIKNSLIKAFGVEHPLQSEQLQKKFKETCIKKYGIEYPSQNVVVLKRTLSSKKLLYNDIIFDSSWELAFFIYLTDNNISFTYHPNAYYTYILNNKEHRYFPDFLVEGQYIEIKGDHFFKKPTEKFIKKLEIMKENNIIILRKSDCLKFIKYVNNKYGSNYLRSFKINKM